MTVWREMWIPLLAVAFAIGYATDTADLAPRSVVFPYAIMILMGVFGAVVLAEAWRRDRAGETRTPAPWPDVLRGIRRPAMLVVMSVAYLAVFAATNFIVASILFLAVAMIAYRVSWPKAIAIAVGFTVGLYVVFGVLFAVPI